MPTLSRPSLQSVIHTVTWKKKIFPQVCYLLACVLPTKASPQHCLEAFISSTALNRVQSRMQSARYHWSSCELSLLYLPMQGSHFSLKLRQYIMQVQEKQLHNMSFFFPISSNFDFFSPLLKLHERLILKIFCFSYKLCF